jgi:predicted aspartyl protease
VLPLRVKLLIKAKHSGRDATVKALVNTGFTTETPDIAIPVSTAEQLNLWPIPSQETIKVSLETGGGTVEGYIVPQSLIVRVVTGDRMVGEAIANALINPYIGEVLISDSLAEELGIQILYPRRGIWKFVDEEKLRESE